MRNKKSIRKFIRHPSDVPIQVVLDRVVEEPDDDTTLTNVSLGGLSFISSRKLQILDRVRVCIPILQKENCLTGIVVWCEKAAEGYEVGLEFERSQEIFRLRMIEQICHIEHYRKEIESQQGRKLSTEEAAKEWISEYAGDFPAM
ncbi:MAG: PilZ domain-containing protein [Gammaproteobacteria bacterium]|nr:PilZ domain-containing protein [Gammaproteobacteria bacterium]